MAELDNCTVYIFIRQDIPLAMQLVQSNHATFTMASQMPRGTGIPNVIVVGVPHIAALKRVLHKLEAAAIPAERFEDPDLPVGITAVCTYPLTVDDKKPLANYRLWRDVPPLVQASHFDVDGGANAAVAQLREHSVSNGEVVGANPSSGSNSIQG